MKKKYFDMVGHKYGRLLVLAPVERTDIVSRAKCFYVECDCGRKLIVRGHAMRSKNTKACCICSHAG